MKSTLYPELSLEEARTLELVAAQLQAWGIPVERGLGKTGVIGILKAGKLDAIGLRADMDALSMNKTALRIALAIPGKCMLAVTTAIPPCCLPPLAI